MGWKHYETKNQIDCKAGTTAEGQNLLANKFCPSAVVPALQPI